MTNSPENDADEDIFNLFLSAEEINNKRTAVRYIRSDITASFRFIGFFSSAKFHPIELLNISSKGAAFKSNKPISLSNTIVLKLLSDKKPVFELTAKIIYRKKQLYGIKFERINNKLGDFLISSDHEIRFY